MLRTFRFLVKTFFDSVGFDDRDTGSNHYRGDFSGGKISAFSLPAGGRRIKDQYVPPELRGIFAKLVAAGGDQIRQGDSEVIIWGGNFQQSNGSEMIANLVTSLKNSGWELQIGFQENDCVLFGLYRTVPERRALVGFFIPTDDTFIFAVTEMVPAGGPAAAAFQPQPNGVEVGNFKPTLRENVENIGIFD